MRTQSWILFSRYQQRIAEYRHELDLSDRYCKPSPGAMFHAQRLVRLQRPDKAKEYSKEFSHIGINLDELTACPKGDTRSNSATNQSVPAWFPLAGAIVLGVELIYFMLLAVLSLSLKLSYDTRQLLTIVLAIGAAASVFFLGGSASAKGHIPLPFAKVKPMAVAVSGGVAALVIVWLLGYWIWAKGSHGIGEDLGSLPKLRAELLLLIGGYELRVVNDGGSRAQGINVDVAAWQAGSRELNFKRATKSAI